MWFVVAYVVHELKVKMSGGDKNPHKLRVAVRRSFISSFQRSEPPDEHRAIRLIDGPVAPPHAPLIITHTGAQVGHAENGAAGLSAPQTSVMPDGSRQARHVHILQIGLRLTIAQTDARPVMSISFR